MWQKNACTRCLYTICRGLSAQHLSVSPWYPLVGIPIGVHSPHPTRLGHPSRLKIITLAGLLPAFNCSGEIFAMDILAESRLTFRQGLTVQLSQWLVVNRCVVTKTCRKKAKLVATPLESFGNLRLKRSVPSSMSSRFRPDPTKRTKVPAIPWRRGQSSASPHAPQSQCQCHTIDTWCRLLSAPTGACTLTNGRCHTTYCIPDNAIVATHEVPTGRIGNKHTLRGYSTRFTVLQYTVPCTWPVPESTWPHTVLALVLDIIGSCWLCIVGGPGRVAAGPGLCRNGTHEMAVCD